MNQNALGHIIDRAHERREKWHTSELENLPDISQLKESTILGSFSYCLLSTRQRLLKRPECLPVDHVIETPSAVARDFLLYRYKRGPIVKHTQMETIREGMRANPNYAHPTLFNFGFYVDIQAAYWSIMRAVGWNPDYYPERWLSPGVPPLEFPFSEHKKARNCLVSAGLSSEIPLYDINKQEIVPMKRGNVLANLSLVRLIGDVLNAIATQAIELGAVYANTDGFICPDVSSRDRVWNLIQEWGLTPSIKARGPGGVFSSGAYALGRVKSGHNDHRQNLTPLVNVSTPRYHAWLQRNFTFWVSRQP